MHRQLALASSLAVAIGLCIQLSGCNSSGSDPSLPQLTTPDATNAQHEIASINASTSESTGGPNFATAQYIDASSSGLVGDGKTDNTTVLRNLLGSGDRTIHIPAGDYITGKLLIPPNTALLLDPGVIFQDSGNLGPYDPLITIQTTNVYISGSGAKVLGGRSIYPPGEMRHGVWIWGATNVVIQGLESSENAGDGFYIGGPAGQPSNDILLDGCLASQNRRQGLSITSARNVNVVDCQFQYTNGTAPQFGIDLEPDTADDFLDHILILRPFTLGNYGGGIAIYLEHLTANSYPIDIEILEHLSQSESPPLATLGSPYIPGTIQYTRASTSP